MKENSLDQPMAENPDPGQETWLSKEEVMERYKVTDRQLEYWRDIGRIRYQKIKHLTYYLESEIQKQAKKQARPKKFLFIRKALFGKKVRDIDPPLALLIVAAFYLLLNALWGTDHWELWLIHNSTSIFLILIALCWYLIRLLVYIYRRFFEKEEEEDDDDDDE